MVGAFLSRYLGLRCGLGEKEVSLRGTGEKQSGIEVGSRDRLEQSVRQAFCRADSLENNSHIPFIGYEEIELWNEKMKEHTKTWSPPFQYPMITRLYLIPPLLHCIIIRAQDNSHFS